MHLTINRFYFFYLYFYILLKLRSWRYSSNTVFKICKRPPSCLSTNRLLFKFKYILSHPITQITALSMGRFSSICTADSSQRKYRDVVETNKVMADLGIYMEWGRKKAKEVPCDTQRESEPAHTPNIYERTGSSCTPTAEHKKNLDPSERKKMNDTVDSWVGQGWVYEFSRKKN